MTASNGGPFVQGAVTPALIWLVDWGDGTTIQVPAGTIDAAARPPTTSTTVTHVYQTPGQYEVGLLAVDQDGQTAATQPITVLPIAPTLSLDDVAAVPAGSATDLTGTIAEPGQGDTFALSIDWGDGGSAATFITVQQASSGFELKHQYAAIGSYTIAGIVTDRYGGIASANTGATVTPRPPTIATAAFTTAAIPEGGFGATGTPPVPATLAGTLAPSLTTDTDTVSVAWGGGTSSAAAVDDAAHSFTATHLYLDNPARQPTDSYTAVITTTDENGAQAIASAEIEVRRSLGAHFPR